MTGTDIIPLEADWRLCATPPGVAESPDELPDDAAWREARVPGTVATAFASVGLDEHEDYDEHDWWYRTSFSAPEGADRARLVFEGLATLAEVWLNGELILESSNMFVPAAIEVGGRLHAENDLVIAFRSLGSATTPRRPRPRWKTRLVSNQKLRWFRTTLLGRIPGWTPAIAAVGPWRPVRLEVTTGPRVRELELRAGWNGSEGTLRLQCEVDWAADDDVVASVEIAGEALDLPVSRLEGHVVVSGEIVVPGVEPWWPRTHGTPMLYAAQLRLRGASADASLELGSLGFRSVAASTVEGAVQLVVNDVPIFCRGACWTTNDIVSLAGSPETMRDTLELLADANANMIRVGGTMVYESDAFYEACDELGLMVWQDFMFANMDYPVDDPAFHASVGAEARHQVRRLAAHPCVVAWCGGSEVEQQAAMFGAPREAWGNALFTDLLPEVVAELGGAVPYWPSTPTGGALPFHVDSGLAHYYGVGAYRRPLDDARLSDVSFAPECLGFSNVPEPTDLRRLSRHHVPAPHDPEWKRGVPRDSGAGWDFEDIRDHYLKSEFGVDPVESRSTDLDRYHELSRVITGYVMGRVFDEWRSPNHPCGGGLVWFARDIRPGAGWGIIDSGNAPKPAYWYLRRAWAPVRAVILDRGINGLVLEVHNETEAPIAGLLRSRLIGLDGTELGSAEAEISVPARGTVAMNLEEMAGRFLDASYSYRFGPRRHVAVTAELTSPGLSVPASIHWIVPPTELWPAEVAGSTGAGGEIALTTNRPARAVRLDVDEATPSDNYVDLVPGGTARSLALSGTPDGEWGYLEALNGREVRFGLRAADPD